MSLLKFSRKYVISDGTELDKLVACVILYAQIAELITHFWSSFLNKPEPKWITKIELAKNLDS